MGRRGVSDLQKAKTKRCGGLALGHGSDLEFPVLIVRTAQVLSLLSPEIERYLEEALPELSEAWPGLLRGGADHLLRERMRLHARAAYMVGLRSRGEWLRYLNVAIALGDNFAGTPEAAAILGADLPPGARLEQLVRWAETSLRSR